MDSTLDFSFQFSVRSTFSSQYINFNYLNNSQFSCFNVKVRSSLKRNVNLECLNLECFSSQYINFNYLKYINFNYCSRNVDGFLRHQAAPSTCTIHKLLQASQFQHLISYASAFREW